MSHAILQEDGAPSLGLIAREFQNEEIPGRWIRKYRPFPWRPCSLDFFLHRRQGIQHGSL